MIRKIGLAVSLLLLTSCSSQSSALPQTGEVVSCDSIARSASGEGVVLPCLDGKSSLNISALKGPLIVNVWGSWCASCKDELPILLSFYSKSQSRLPLLGIDVEEAKKEDGSAFVLRSGMTWPNLIDLDGRTRSEFGMGVPVTWFIDKSGTVLYKKIGVLKNEAELQALTLKYLHIAIG